MKNISAQIVSNDSVEDDYYLMIIKPEQSIDPVIPGQFVILRKLPTEEGPFTGWALPVFAVDDKGSLGFFYRAAGQYQFLKNRQPQLKVQMTAPAGKGFTIKDSLSQAVLVTDGDSIASLYLLAQSLMVSKKKVVLICQEKIPNGCLKVFTDLGVQCQVVEENVIKGVEALFENSISQASAIYAAGSTGMLKDLAEFSKTSQVPMQVSLLSNTSIGCGTGGGRCCPVPDVEDIEGQPMRYHLCCQDGPVFGVSQIGWQFFHSKTENLQLPVSQQRNLEEMMLTEIAGVKFRNPIWIASGLLGYFENTERSVLEQVGAVVTKTVTFEPKAGSLPPRFFSYPYETFNSVGLANEGAEVFKTKEYPRLKALPTTVIVSVAGHTPNELIQCANLLKDGNFPSVFELNLSCPNIVGGKVRGLVAQSPEATEQFVGAFKLAVRDRPVFVKLTPEVTNIVEIAKAAERGGADALVLANGFIGVVIDPETRTALFHNVKAEVGGPAIKPLAIRRVLDVHNSDVKIPIIGCGGVSCGNDVVEYLLAGACAVQVGVANMADSYASVRILEQFENYLKGHPEIGSLEKDLVGQLRPSSERTGFAFTK